MTTAEWRAADPLCRVKFTAAGLRKHLPHCEKRK